MEKGRGGAKEEYSDGFMLDLDGLGRELVGEQVPHEAGKPAKMAVKLFLVGEKQLGWKEKKSWKVQEEEKLYLHEKWNQLAMGNMSLFHS